MKNNSNNVGRFKYLLPWVGMAAVHSPHVGCDGRVRRIKRRGPLMFANAAAYARWPQAAIPQGRRGSA